MQKGTKKIIENGFVLGIVLLALVSAECLLNRDLSFRQAAWVDTGEKVGRKWDPRLMRILSFGHLPAVVDWLWLKVLMDSELFHVASGTHPQMYYEVDTITDLDSAFYVAYHAGANILAVIRNDGVGARDLLIKARKFMDKDLKEYPVSFQNRYWTFPWAISFSLAYVYLFELDDLPHAALEFKNTARFSGAPDYIRKLAKRFETPGGEFEVGLRLLDFMALQNHDDRVAHRFEEKRQSLQVSKFLYDLNDRYQKSSRREGIPARDPWGGVLRMGESGKIETSTPHEKVFGMG